MSLDSSATTCAQSEWVALLVVDALPAPERDALWVHIVSCPECGRELDKLNGIRDGLVFWPTDILRPHWGLWGRVVERIAAEAQMPPAHTAGEGRGEPEWVEVVAGISCKLLSTDTERGLVSMLVRLGPGVEYPPHLHADFEELHLLDGELWIAERKLLPGDFNRAEVGTSDSRVWSETGCTCFLTTSLRDVLG